jgi:flagellar biogenesis protein FliO
MNIWSYLQTVGSLLGILVLLGVILKISKFTQGKRFSGDIKIIDRRGIDSGVTLMVVQVKNEEFLLSISNKSVQVLKTYPLT